MRRQETIARAIETFTAATEADSLRSVRPAQQSPYKMWRIGEDGYAIPVTQLEGSAEPYNMPRQLLPMVYWQDGYIDITRPEVIFEQRSTTGLRILPFLIEEECVEIDYEEELLAAEQLLVDRSITASRRSGPSPTKHPS